MVDRKGLVTRRLHRVSHQILHKDRALLQKFWKHPNLPKYSYYSNALTTVRAFFGSITEFVRFGGNCS